MKGITLPTETAFVMKMIGIEGERAMIRITSYCARLSLALAVVGTLLSATAARGDVGGTTPPTLTYAATTDFIFPNGSATGTLTPPLNACPPCAGIVVSGVDLTYTANPADSSLPQPLQLGWFARRRFNVSPPPPPSFKVVTHSHLDGFASYDTSKFTVLDISLHSVVNDGDTTTLDATLVPSASPGCPPFPFPFTPSGVCFSGDKDSPAIEPDFFSPRTLGNGALTQFFTITFTQSPTATTTDTITLHLPNSVSSTVVLVTPVVPFAAFAARLEVERHDGQFELDAVFNLGATSDGIQPLTEDVMLQIGTFSVTIPAGSFRAGEDENDGEHRDGMDRDKPGHEDHDRTGRQRPRFTFQGVIDDVSLEVKLLQTGTSTFKLKAEGQGANLGGIVNPVTIGLAIGDDGGSISIMTDFDE